MGLKSPEAIRKRNFIRAIYYDVERISKGSGIPTKLVLAMAALETGWGEKFLFEGSGNLFNVKAFANYNGKKTAKKDVLEYESDGTPTTESSSFRIYDSYIESIEGLIGLLKTDKYKVVRNMKSIENKADALGPGFIGPPGLTGPRLKGAGYATNLKYGKLLKDILNQDRLKDALRGLPTRDELEWKILDRVCDELEYETILTGYKGIPIARSELKGVLDTYNVCVSHKGEKVGELTKKSPELRARFLVDIIYYPGRMKSDKKSFQSDFLKITYRSNQASLYPLEVWWSIDKKGFVDSAPSMQQFRPVTGVHNPLEWVDSSLSSRP